MEFVANKTDHEFDEFHENDHCRQDVIWLEIQFFTVSPAALLDSTFNCTPEVRPHGRGYVLPAYGLTRRSASWFLLFFEEQELTLGLVLFSHLGEETGVLVAGLGVACVQPDRFLK